MSHSIYTCCAICDREIKEGKIAKASICQLCQNNLKRVGYDITNVKELKDFLWKASKEKVIDVLKEVGYIPCLYPNEVDHVVNCRNLKTRDFINKNKQETKIEKENKESLLLLRDIVKAETLEELNPLRNRFYEINNYHQAKKILEYFVLHEVKEEKSYTKMGYFFLRMWNMWLHLGGLKE